MTMQATRETRGFQAEVKQLLKLMIHSLYSHKEIFLRELISNASDACDKLRFESLADASLLREATDLGIRLEVDSGAGTLTVTDNGIGMSREEIVEHLGTIARSGTAEFLGRLTGDQQKDAQLIGQFGVGFYSAFIVADRVEVFSRRAGVPAEQGVHWESRGEGEFTVDAATLPERGTRVVLHLKTDERDFASAYLVRSLVRRYSDHIGFPVRMRKETADDVAADDGTDTWEVVNHAQALWTRPRNEISDEQYREFYRHVTHDLSEPLAWSHNRVEGKREYTSLLYVPARAPFDLWNREAPRGLKLYVRRVFIMDDAEQFLPLYLRFIKGVVDSADLPLNVSRELLQHDPSTEAMKSALTRRALDLLARLATDEPDKYAGFWREFGSVVKEGPAEDFGNRERIAKLLRFASTRSEADRQDVSLDNYVARMKPGQDSIYYLIADSAAAARTSPHLEALKARDVEVLLLWDRIDEWLMQHLTEFDGRQLRNVSRGELDLSGLQSAEEQQAQKELGQEHSALVERIAAVLGDRVARVRVTNRLTDSPACLVLAEHDPGHQMRRLLEAAGQKLPTSRPSLELNPAHPLLAYMSGLQEGDRFRDLAELLLEEAMLADGAQLAEPAAFVQRLNRLLLDAGGQ